MELFMKCLIFQIIPAYEPLSFPLTEVSLVQMKKEMPEQKSRRQPQQQQQQNIASNSTPSDNFFVSLETSHPPKQIQVASVKRGVVRPSIKKRKHNDSISESILIKEKLPSSALSTVGKNNNVLIPRNKNSHNLLNSIDLKGADSAALKKLMNNNNGDLINGGANSVDLDEVEDNEMDNSDSETVTGDESLEDPEEEEDDDDQDLFEPDEEEEEEEDDDTESDEEEYLEEYEDKVYTSKKKNNSTSIVDCHY